MSEQSISQNEEKETIYILGAGSLGCLWASALKASDNHSTLILRPNIYTSSNKTHLHFKTKVENETDFNFDITAKKPNELFQAAKIILVTTKATDTIEALTGIKHIITDQTIIILFQNGMGIQDEVTDLFPNNPVVCAVTTEGAYCESPLHVTHAGKGSTKVGLYSWTKNKEQGFEQSVLDLIFHALKNPYLDLILEKNITQSLWKKLTVNVAINAYTVIFNCKNGELLDNSQALIRIKSSCQELALIEKSINVNTEELQKDIDKKQLTISQRSEEAFKQVTEVLRNTTENYSSMYQDIKKNKTTEIDYINGYILKIARQKNIPCPEIQNAYFEIKKLEK